MGLKLHIRRRVSVALALGGAGATSGQIILLRELLVVFQGNELSLGAILAGWLFWIACGSLVIGTRADRFRKPVFVLGLLLGLAALALPATVLASAALKIALRASPVETLGLFEFLPAVLVLLAPMCFILGSLFAVGARILDELAPAHNEVSHAYLLESAGAGIGGLVISLVVLPYLEPLALSLALGALLLLANVLLAADITSKRSRLTVRALLIVAAVAFACAAALPQPDRLRRQVQWQGIELLEAKNSLLGSLAAIKMEEQVSLYENGLLVATSGYQAHAEELVHLGMVQHPGPRRVLLVGGGLGGTLRELGKYPFVHCDYIELDPEVLALARRYLPANDMGPLGDPRLSIHHLDGRYFAKTTARKYDMVMLDLPGPRTAQLNRFYTVEFFRELEAILDEEGVAVFGIASSEAYPAAEQRVLLASLKKTALLIFPHVATLPGDTCYFVLSKKLEPLTDPSAILAKLNQAGIERKYLRERFLRYRLSSWRKQQLEKALGETAHAAQVNRDFRPLGYLYDLAQWSAQFRGPLRQWMIKLMTTDPRWAYLIPVALLLSLGICNQLLRSRHRRRLPAEGTDHSHSPPARPFTLPAGNFAVGAAVGVTGISEIVFQVTVLVSFQVIYGYLFYRLGIMVAAFMAGLAGGSLWLWKRGELAPVQAWHWFLGVHVAILFYPLLLPVLFRLPVPSEAYMFLPAVAGFLGGLEFPLAVRLWREAKISVGTAAGSLYAIDSFGACVGAAVVSPFLIPLVGLVGICWWTALLNLGTLALLLLPALRKPGRQTP